MNDARYTSWLPSANEPCGFGLNHLPMGVMRSEHGEHICVAVGDSALDLARLAEHASAPLAAACRAETLNPLLQLGVAAWRELRSKLQAMLHESADDTTQQAVRAALVPRDDARMLYPLHTRGYVDFYASIDHARRVGEIFRPDTPLLPNYRHVPIAYNGRASSLCVSGTAVRRPWGQRRGEGPPIFAPTAALDYELEMAFVVAHGNEPGETIGAGDAARHLFGVALLNDWSARDIQSWEYQPLGPFLGKSFATSLSAWITPMLALEEFRCPAAAHESAPLPYLTNEDDQQHGALDVSVEAWLSTAGHRQPVMVSRGSTKTLFWTPGQMLAHATSNGCPVETGDLLASGTISGPEISSAGCLMELTRNGANPLLLASREQRGWLEDGDEVILRAFAERDDVPRVALGECRGKVLPAHMSVVAR